MADSRLRQRMDWLALALSLLLTFLVAGISGALTLAQISSWYSGLAKPGFNPPSSVFGPAWALLYTLMAVAAWLVWRRPASRLRSRALLLYGLQLALNFFWSLIFFRWHQIGGALVEVLLLWLLIAGATVLFFRLSRVAGWLFVPYLAWVSFASFLNFAIWRLN